MITEVSVLLYHLLIKYDEKITQFHKEPLYKRRVKYSSVCMLAKFNLSFQLKT